MVCMLVSFMSVLTIVPLLMLSMITILPESGVQYLFSSIDHKNKQSTVPCDENKCKEIELFHDWHASIDVENKLLQKVNASIEILHDEESPELLSVSLLGRLSSGKVEEKTVTGPVQPPSSNESLGESPMVLDDAPPVQPPNIESSDTSPGLDDTPRVQVANTDSSLTSMWPAHPQLRWIVKNSDAQIRFMQKRAPVEPRSITEAELDGSHWVGRIPKVSCIMGLPSSPWAYAQLKDAVNNFRSQKYEGPRQLIIVYHFQDQEARTKVRRLSRGNFIKGVPARTMEVPSPTAMRFGAWAADEDTDIIARWDVDNWHHPDQLSMQVRALALSGRPACLLKRWTVTLAPDGGDRTALHSEVGGEHSLMGQRAWMDENWEPFHLDGLGVAVLQGRKASLALLDMPHLLIHHPDTSSEQKVVHHVQPADKLHAYLAIRYAYPQ